MKIAGSGSVSQRHESADPDPDPYQTVMDPQHCIKTFFVSVLFSTSWVYCGVCVRGQLDLELTLRDQRMVSDLSHVPRRTKLALRCQTYI
jgi:hypothetical protein